MFTGVDHVVILVGDLETAIRSYRSLGLAVEPGGVHPRWQTENALSVLADGAYLELLAARDPGLAAGHRLWQRPDGRRRDPGEYGGFMVGSDDLAADTARLRALGIALDAPSPGARTRPDGRQVRWQLVFPERLDLPAIIQDDTPRSMRVPPPAAGLNTRTRLADVTVVVVDLDEAASAYGRVLGANARDEHDPYPAGAARFGTARSGAARFATPRGSITLTAPAPGEPAFDYLREHGPGVYSITLAVAADPAEVSSPAASRRRQGLVRLVDPSSTGGVRICFEESAGRR